MRLSVTNTIQLLYERQWYCLLSYFKIFYEPYTAIDKMNKLIVVCITIADGSVTCSTSAKLQSTKQHVSYSRGANYVLYNLDDA